MMNMAFVETVENGRYYLAIGNKAPWDNLWIRVPYKVFALFNPILVKWHTKATARRNREKGEPK
jgi:hypothetical protein